MKNKIKHHRRIIGDRGHGITPRGTYADLEIQEFTQKYIEYKIVYDNLAPHEIKKKKEYKELLDNISKYLDSVTKYFIP